MKLSVIICVYNTKKELLSDCIDSIRRQNLGDYEICLVDDGSTCDYSDLIRHPEIRYVKTENRGILAARLTGVSMAVGDYVTFVDSDDTVSHYYHPPMLRKAEDANADIVYNDWAFHTSRMRYFCTEDSTIAGTLNLSEYQCLFAFAEGEGREHSYYVLWNKIYKRELLLSSIRLAAEVAASLPSFNYAEDVLINFYAHRDARRVVGVHTGYYFYRIHSDQSVTVTDKEKLRHQIDCMALVLSAMRRGVPEGEGYASVREGIRGWENMISRTHYSYAKSGGYSDLFGYIKSAYRQKRLRKPKYFDSAVYVAHGLLGTDFEIQDGILASLWTKQGRICVNEENLSDYHRRVLSEMIKSGMDVEIAPDGAITLPPPGISLRERLLHRPLLYRLGVILVPKGSRLRSYLKKKL